MNNVIAQFAHTSSVISDAVTKLMSIEHKAPNTFRLSVATPNDVQEEGNGQYRVEAPILVALLDTAYAEIVSLANRTTRKDAQIALHDRHRYASGWDDQYDGSDDPEETEESIEEQLVNAVDRAEVVLRYAKHIAAVKDGGAQWLAGFEVDKWVPVEGLNGEEYELVAKACLAEANLADHIKMGRVQKVRTVVENRLLPFNEWCDNQIHRKGVDDSWKNKCAYARICDIHINDIPVNTAMEYIGDIALSSAFNRLTTRLEDAMSKVANTNYMRVAYTLANNVAATTVNKREIDKAMAKAWEFLPYSKMLQADIKDVLASDEWQDHQLDLDVKRAEEEAKQDERQAYRELTMFNIEKRALAIAETRTKADSIRALIAKERSELLAPKPAAQSDEVTAKRAEAAKKAAETRAKNKAAKEAAKHVKGIHKASNKPVYDTTGVRH